MTTHVFQDGSSELQETFLSLLTEAGLPHPNDVDSPLSVIKHSDFKTLSSAIEKYLDDNDSSQEDEDKLREFAQRYLDLSSPSV